MKKLYTSLLAVFVLVFSYTAQGQTSDKATLSPAEKVTEEPVKKAAVNQETPKLATTSKNTVSTEPSVQAGSDNAPKLAEKQRVVEPPEH